MLKYLDKLSEKLLVQEVAGPLQSLIELQDGSQAVINVMKNIFEFYKIEAMILVDASNAFNSLSRMVTLHSVQVL